MKRIVLGLLGLLACSALSAEANKVKVDVYVVNVSKLDLAAGKYTANLELSLTGPGSKDLKFNLLNGEFEPGKLENTTEPEEAAQGITTYKAVANLDFDPDFAKFPWDVQDLSIYLVSEKKTDEIVFEPVTGEESSIAERANFPGWKIQHDKPTVSETSFQHPNEKFSVYEFPIEISRNPLASFMKVFFPLLIMILLSLLAVFVGPGAIANRLTIVTGTLLGAVMFQLNATSSLPQIGYLTLADKIFLATYISFLINVGLTMYMWKKNDAKNEEAVKKIYNMALYVVPGASLVVYILAIALA
ncbi:MAG: hypothetical protein JNM27_07930 [Leptospirales bacterium]|nr:hypothetical protein [Leptospirales bacterium]